MSLQSARAAVTESDRNHCGVFEAETLLRRLVELVERSSAPAQTRKLKLAPEPLGEVVYEMEVEGSQYLIIRVQPQVSDQVSLSPRELAIVRLVAKGLPNKTIGTILEISPWTVATHLRRIFMKLEVTTRAAMIARLVERQLI